MGNSWFQEGDLLHLMIPVWALKLPTASLTKAFGGFFPKRLKGKSLPPVTKEDLVVQQFTIAGPDSKPFKLMVFPALRQCIKISHAQKQTEINLRSRTGSSHLKLSRMKTRGGESRAISPHRFRNHLPTSQIKAK